MLLQETRTARGVIVAVQEQSFRLLTDEGHALLLTLIDSANASSSDLGRYRDEAQRVEVIYTGDAGMESGAAQSVRPV